MTEYLLGTGRVMFGPVKMPRSKKKRIRNKWIKKQSEVATDFKVTVSKKELLLKSLKPIAIHNFTLDDISEEYVKALMLLSEPPDSKFMDAVNTPSSEDTHIFNLYKGETK